MQSTDYNNSYKFKPVFWTMKKMFDVMLPLAIVGGLVYGCVEVIRNHEPPKCKSNPPHIIHGEVTQTNYDQDFWDGSNFSFTIDTEKYGTKQFWANADTAKNRKNKILKGDKLEIKVDACRKMNQRVFENSTDIKGYKHLKD